jgi:predicted permease
MLQDLRLALRALRLQPGFSAVAILTLALGVGATTAIFSAVNTVALKPLPFHEPENLYRFKTKLSDGRITAGTVSYLELTRLSGMKDVVQSATGALRYEGSLVDRNGEPIRAVMQGVAPRFFSTFGVPLAEGRDFTPDEVDPASTAQFAAILSYRAWRNWFGQDRSILGQSITMEGGQATLVGIAAEGFNFPGGTDLWFAIKIPPEDTGHISDGYIRLRPGVTIDQARAAFEPVALQLQKDFPNANALRLFDVQPLLDTIVGPLRPTLLIILAASALLLIVACINVTSLLLSRGVVRARDVAVRVALGASRGQIVRQLLIESIVLAGFGALAGLLLAALSLKLMIVVGASELPRFNDVRLDTTALVFTLVATVVTGLVVGFAPALRLMRTDVKGLMNESGRGFAGSRATHRMLNGLVIAEIAMAVVLTIGAGLLVKSFWKLKHTDAGFTPGGRIAFEVSLPVFTYGDWNRLSDWYGDLLTRIKTVPGVQNAGAISSAPLGPELDGIITFWKSTTGMLPVEQRPRAKRRSVSPDFFKAAGIPMLKGRAFTDQDRRDTPGVAIVDELFANSVFPEGNAIGQTVVFRPNPEPTQNPITIVRPQAAEIVGIVRSVRFASVGAEPEPTIYLPIEQVARRQLIFVVNTALEDPTGLIGGVRKAVLAGDPKLAVNYYDLGTLVERSMARERMSMTLLSLFGVVALILAAVGIYGTMAYSVAQRRGEFAVRAALGAEPSWIRNLVLSQGRTFGLIGGSAGLAIAAGTGKWVETQLVGISAFDVTVLVGMTVLMFVVVLVATLIPAFRASRVRASAVLRTD